MKPEDHLQAVISNLHARSAARGQWQFPCLPAAEEYYLHRLIEWLADWGKPMRADEVECVRQTLRQRLDEGFQLNAGAKLIVDFELTVTPTLQKNLMLHITHQQPDLAGEYAQWVGADQRPLFGVHADARALQAVAALGSPPNIHVLDVGAGDGRNAVPLARLGCTVDAVELTPLLADRLRQTVRQQAVNIRVLEGNLFDEHLPLTVGKYQLVLLSGVVSHFRSADQLRQWMARMADLLAPSGQALLNMFLADRGYQPDALVRQMSQAAWASLFTYDELEWATKATPLTIVADDPVYAYEKANLPNDAWPPTPWFETWCRGRSVMPVGNDRPPFEMRWILLERK